MVILYVCIFVIVFHIIDTTRLGLRHLLTGRPIIIIIPISKPIQGYLLTTFFKGYYKRLQNHHYESYLLRYISRKTLSQHKSKKHKPAQTKIYETNKHGDGRMIRN